MAFSFCRCQSPCASRESKELLNSSLKENFFSELNPLDAGFFFLIEVETEHISRVQTEIVQVLADLFFSRFMVTLPAPDLQFAEYRFPIRIPYFDSGTETNLPAAF